MTVQPIDGWRFFVKGGKMDCVVDLEHGKCDCGVYAVEKIPCSHAIAAGTSVGLHISTLVCPVYSKDYLFAGYSENIYPCVGQQVEERTCFPPEVKRDPRRQKKSRWQSWLELSRMRGRKPQRNIGFIDAQNAKKLAIRNHNSVHATITRSGRRYIGRSRICEWLQAVLGTFFVGGSALNKQIRDHVEKMLHYLIEFCWGDTGTNVVKDDYVPFRDQYPHSNPMSVLVVHWRIDIINICPPNLVRLGKLMV
ncbi:hypothetical protein F2Q68_00010784 [Brassica cretica]|uniref:SWIM-type domain-containing protein n=1 Tax=Brassica cretica TaxID=69181 RepID=A0A8S9KRZ2_BRACR|nr:hypothetical protein F2Q68_00010784 [Brassica cretica]